MNPLRFIPAVAAILLASRVAASADGDPAIACRREAFELAGAWANDGFRFRDSFWSGLLTPGKPSLLRVTLFAGNRYWFTAAAARTAAELSVTVYSDDGKPLPSEHHREGNRAAAQFAPLSSGTYLVRVEQSGGSPSPFCLVYSYK